MCRRTTMIRLAAAAMWLGLVACDTGGAGDLEEGVDTADSAIFTHQVALQGSDPCVDSPLTWESFGASFVWTWCTPCHSSALTVEERQEAPVEVNFDTYEDVVAWAGRIEARSGPGGDMPPAGGPDDEERSLLVEWVRCDLP